MTANLLPRWCKKSSESDRNAIFKAPSWNISPDDHFRASKLFIEEQLRRGWSYERLCECKGALIEEIRKHVDWPELRNGRIQRKPEALDGWEKSDNELDKLLGELFDCASWDWEGAQSPAAPPSTGA